MTRFLITAALAALILYVGPAPFVSANQETDDPPKTAEKTSGEPEQDSESAEVKAPAELARDQEPDKTAVKPELPKGLQRLPNGNLRFSFEAVEWEPVINWFADQGGFSFQPTDDYPEGTFTYHDDAEYTVMEGLDQINHALSLRRYTMILNRKMLVLRSTSQPLPDELIEEVTADQLDERGKYEIVRCVFDLAGLDNSEIVTEVERLVTRANRDSVVHVPSAKKLYVREIGEKLRTIRDLIDEARRLKIAGAIGWSIYELQHIPGEELLVIVRPMLGMQENANAMEDGSLAIIPEPLGDKLYLKGTKSKIDDFRTVAAMVDIASKPNELQTLVRPTFRVYPVKTEKELTWAVVNTMLEGRDVKLDQDAVTGSLILQGRPDDHRIVVETIEAIASGTDSFVFVKLENRTPDAAVTALQAVFGQDPDEPTTSGPIFYIDSDTDRLLVRGTPQEIAFVQTLLRDFDKDRIGGIDGFRAPSRIISMSDSQADQILQSFADSFNVTGRNNRVNIIGPDERSSLRRGLPTHPDLNSLEHQLPGDGGATPKDSTNGLEKESESSEAQQQPNEKPLPKKSDDGASSSTTNLSARTTFFVSTPLTIQDPENQDETKKALDDQSSAAKTPDEYRPPVQVPSVPNAPLTLKRTSNGLVLSSLDLDALDDAERLIADMLEGESTEQKPHVFLLKYRKANEAKTLLETMLGLSSGGGGGGGGGIPGMLGNMASNIMGGTSGDIMSGLLGGGGASDTPTSLQLEGTVSFVEDVRLNSLLVSGATDNDLDLISQLIDWVDQPEAPHAPDLVGPTWPIPVKYRDPENLKTIIEKQYGELLSGAGQQGSNDPNAAAQRQQMEMMQQMQRAMLGRGGGGNQNADPEKLKPVAVLGVDIENN
jgi:type II secretory pathway component GspD/PulD (secretin)